MSTKGFKSFLIILCLLNFIAVPFGIYFGVNVFVILSNMIAALLILCLYVWGTLS